MARRERTDGDQDNTGTPPPGEQLPTADGNPTDTPPVATPDDAGFVPFTLTPEEEEALRQRPAAFQFGVINGKIDALPYSPEAPPTEVQQDLYDELKEKLEALADRLTRTNAAPDAARSVVARMRDAMGAELSELRPGRLLSRSYSIDGIRSGFNSEEGRAELPSELIAIMEDVALSTQGLLVSFPETRKIVRESLALGIERKPEVLIELRSNADAITAAANSAQIVTKRAAEALCDADPDIAATPDPEKQADILADKLLTVRNFLFTAVRTLAHSRTRRWIGSEISEAWGETKPHLHRGLQRAAQAAPIVGLAMFVASIIDPVIGVATLLADPGFKIVRKTLWRNRRRESAHSNVPALIDPPLGDEGYISFNIEEILCEYLGYDIIANATLLKQRFIKALRHTKSVERIIYFSKFVQLDHSITFGVKKTAYIADTNRIVSLALESIGTELSDSDTDRHLTFMLLLGEAIAKGHPFQGVLDDVGDMITGDTEGYHSD